jgi:alanine racemase
MKLKTNFRISLIAVHWYYSVPYNLPMLHLYSSHITNEVSPAPTANAWIVDTQAFEDNIKRTNQLLNGKTQLCVVMKAMHMGIVLIYLCQVL